MHRGRSSDRRWAPGRARPARVRARRGAARLGGRRGRVLERRRGDPRRLRAAQPGAAGPPRRAPAAARRVAREEPRPGARPGGLHAAAPRPRLPRRRAGRLHASRPAGVDDEVATQAGPQLVVPMLNARFAANAANARWGSLYDALYGTDALPEDDGQERGTSYNPKRGAAVIATGARLPRRTLPAGCGQPRRRDGYAVEDGALTVQLGDGESGLADPAQYVGHRGDPPTPRACCWSTTGCTSRSRSTARTRSARTTPPASRTCSWRRRSPRSWTSRTPSPPSTPTTRCSATATGCSSTRARSPPRSQGRVVVHAQPRAGPAYDGPSGQIVLPGRSLLFVRQVGHLMTTDAMLVRRARRSPRGSSTRS